MSRKLRKTSNADTLKEDAPAYRVNENCVHSIQRGRAVPPPVASLTVKKKLIPFGWYGGKFSHLDWLLPLLPDCHHYCEPFAGSGAVLLNRDPSPVETFNDLDGEVVNFFRVLREEKKRMIEAIGLTPFAREEFAIACEVSPDLPTLERARRFYVRARQVRTGLAQTATIGRWANCKNTSRAGMSGVISRWLGAVDDLPAVAERLFGFKSKTARRLMLFASTIRLRRFSTATRLTCIRRAATRRLTVLK